MSADSVEKGVVPEDRAARIANIIGFDLEDPGRKQEVVQLLEAIDQKREDEIFYFEAYHKVPRVGLSMRLRLMPSSERERSKTGQRTKEFVLKLTTGDYIISDEEEVELESVAAQLAEALKVKCIPIPNRPPLPR